MTGYTVHTGSTEKFSEGWDQIFSSPSKTKAAAKKGGGKSAAKSTAARKKAAVKKSSQKKVKRGKQA